MEDIINNLLAIIALTVLVLLFTGCNVFIDLLADIAGPETESTPAPTYIPNPTDTDGSTYPPTQEPSPESTPDPFSIIGQWVVTEVTLPESKVYDFKSDGICDVYIDYAMTVLYDSYSYSVNGNELDADDIFYSLIIEDYNHFWTENVTKGLSIPIENPKTSIATRTAGGILTHYYKIGTEPGGHYNSYFEKPAETLNEGLWNSNSINATGDWKIYTFTAPSASNYYIEWDDNYDGSGSYTLDVVASCFQANQSTSYFENMDNGYITGQIISLNTNDVIYLVIRGYYVDETGSFAARLTNLGVGNVYTLETFPNGGGNSADTYMFLYDDMLNLLAKNDDINEATNLYSSIIAMLQSETTYYIEIWDSYTNSNYYSFRVSTAGGGGSSSNTPLESEGEPDDDYYDATIVTADLIYDRFLTPGESDWFMFTVP